MKMWSRIRAKLAKPERNITTMKPEFQRLRQALQKASDSDDPLSEIVQFFNAVSRWHDREIGDLIEAFGEVNYGQYDDVLEKLRTLQKHIKKAGRNEFGWNRTKRGETVTDDKVFLGGICGLSTHPVSYWKERKDDKKGGWGFSGMENLNAYDVVSRQAQRFMTSHAGQMIKLLDAITA